ncbi:MAG: hypothetical protein KQH57_11270 [Actinomycetales bacterium]|nr:hypothetical protein [Actinomycetales bacterium]
MAGRSPHLVAAVALLVASAAWAAGGGLTGGSAVAQAGPGRMLTGLAGTSGSGAGSSRALPGTVVDLISADMGAMMGGRGMMGSWAGSTWTGGEMFLEADRTTVAAGTVTLRLTNDGSVDHELVVLPLADGQQVGQRTVGPDGAVDESASLGEASASGTEGAGDGIAPATSGWVTLDLAPGRYELVCNIAGHYAAGMYALLVVT